MGDQRRIELHGINRRASGDEEFCHFAVPGANFKPAERFFGRGPTLVRMRRNVDGTRDFFAPPPIV